MYDAERARIQEVRTRFEREVAEHSPTTLTTAREYLDALTQFLTTFNEGPGGDPRLLGLDTTGELSRLEEQARWAEEERGRVRRILAEGTWR